LIVGGIVLLIIGALILRCYIRRRCGSKKIVISHKKGKGSKQRTSKGKKGKESDHEDDAESGLLDGKAATPVSTPIKPKNAKSSSEDASGDEAGEADNSPGDSEPHSPSKEAEMSDFRQPSFVDDEENVAEFVADLQRADDAPEASTHGPESSDS
jgi:hypothetical protein